MFFWLLATFLATQRHVHFNKQKQEVEYTFLHIIVMYQPVTMPTNCNFPYYKQDRRGS